jgi:NAD(P)-dependent dehydrogenase (short-subunit alcohol dehydrogenase family)
MPEWNEGYSDRPTYSGSRAVPSVAANAVVGMAASRRMQMSSLEGKVAVITGGSSGIGLATARRFAKEGAHVYITGRRQADLDKAVAEIGGNVTGVQGDVQNLADLDRLYAQVKAEKGVVDIVFANAGFIEHARIFDLSEEHYDKTMDINVKGVVFTVQKALPLMTRGGSIVVTASVVGVKGIAAHGIYAAAKAGVRALVRTWVQELKGRNIRVNTLSPGATETPIIRGQFDSDEASEAAKKMFAEATPLGRIGRAEELANAAYFLASDEGSYVNGIDLQVDGGLAQV